jgi:hypothetical protein
MGPIHFSHGHGHSHRQRGGAGGWGDEPAAGPERGLPESPDLVFLDPQKLRFFRHGDALRLTIEGQRSCLDVSVARAFPLSDPRRVYSVRDGDGREVGLIAAPDQLAAADRALVEEELERRYLLPVIRRVAAVKDRFGTVEWEVETDRGRCNFATRDLREFVLRPSPRRYILTDVDGNRYDVPDVGALDARSREWLLRYV